MKKKIFVVCLLLAFTVVQTIAQVKNTGIIPAPASVDWGKGVLNVPSKISFSTNLSGQDLTDITEWMERMKGGISPFEFEQTKSDRKAFLVLNTIKGAPAESYSLKVTDKAIIVEAADKAGVFYALQSLSQMANHFAMNIPVMTIADQPRFEYRGIMLDPARLFISIDCIKKQLDMMAFYKLNKFHIHLTDDCAWRIEIKKYPQLTENLSHNQCESMWVWECGERKLCKKDAPGAVGGFYTQEEIKDLVEYARKLNITVIPEIDLPGHSTAILSQFPEAVCTHQRAGTSGVYCAGNENTFEILENIFTEIMELFPSKMIHVGGDEVSHNVWSGCSRCKDRIDKEKLEGTNQLQSYIIKRMDRFLTSKGRNLVGWDEILHGGLADGATVMSWTGVGGGIEASRQGKKAIMTPEPYCYIDGFQDHPKDLPVSSGWYIPLERVYSYDPAPESLGKDITKNILGVQANLWALWVDNGAEVEFMLWPRAMAIAENGWTPNANKSYAEFRTNAVEAVDKMKSLGYNPFDLKNEKGDRPGYNEKLNALSTDKKVLHPQSTQEHPQGAKLTDGQIGSWRLGDSWFLCNSDMDFVVDLGSVQPIRSVGTTFIQTRGHIIPDDVEIYVSNDNQNFSLLKKIYNNNAWDNRYPEYVSEYDEYLWKGAATGRYIRLKVNSKKPWGADEIIVR